MNDFRGKRPAATSDPFRPLKDAFGRFATGVAVAGCIAKSKSPAMITVNSFSSVSLSPSLISWCIEQKATNFADFMAADAYAISVLRADQRAISERFAMRAPAPPLPQECETWKTGAPLLKERLAGFDCRVTDRVAAGDHVILVAEVVAFDKREGRPLLYFASRYFEGPEAE
jgi:flavin reductase (DIM6/NTAB) family NADH-FMN oxidoreductase RutF